jgi:Ca2+-binding EF-hand superfamily protein
MSADVIAEESNDAMNKRLGGANVSTTDRDLLRGIMSTKKPKKDHLEGKKGNDVAQGSWLDMSTPYVLSKRAIKAEEIKQKRYQTMRRRMNMNTMMNRYHLLLASSVPKFGKVGKGITASCESFFEQGPCMCPVCVQKDLVSKPISFLENTQEERAPAFAIRKLDLRQSDLQKLKRKFRSIDVDDSGEIDYTEFLHLVHAGEASAYTQYLFELVDADNSGSVDFGEFLVLLSGFCLYRKQELMDFCLSVFDGAGVVASHGVRDGFLDEDDYGYLKVNVRRKLRNQLPAWDKLLDRFDLDRDGKLNKEEWRAFVKKFPLLLRPAMHLKNKIKSSTLGNRRWASVFEFQGRTAILQETMGVRTVTQISHIGIADVREHEARVRKEEMAKIRKAEKEFAKRHQAHAAKKTLAELEAEKAAGPTTMGWEADEEKDGIRGVLVVAGEHSGRQGQLQEPQTHLHGHEKYEVRLLEEGEDLADFEGLMQHDESHVYLLINGHDLALLENEDEANVDNKKVDKNKKKKGKNDPPELDLYDLSQTRAVCTHPKCKKKAKMGTKKCVEHGGKQPMSKQGGMHKRKALMSPSKLQEYYEERGKQFRSKVPTNYLNVPVPATKLAMHGLRLSPLEVIRAKIFGRHVLAKNAKLLWSIRVRDLEDIRTKHKREMHASPIITNDYLIKMPLQCDVYDPEVPHDRRMVHRKFDQYDRSYTQLAQVKKRQKMQKSATKNMHDLGLAAGDMEDEEEVPVEEDEFTVEDDDDLDDLESEDEEEVPVVAEKPKTKPKEDGGSLCWGRKKKHQVMVEEEAPFVEEPEPEVVVVEAVEEAKEEAMERVEVVKEEEEEKEEAPLDLSKLEEKPIVVEQEEVSLQRRRLRPKVEGISEQDQADAWFRELGQATRLHKPTLAQIRSQFGTSPQKSQQPGQW